MPVPVVSAELVLDALKARLDLIVGGPEYNTTPTRQIGVPRDALPEGAGEKLYLVHGDSETLFEAVGTHHTERATYHIWCVSNDPVDGQRKALRLVRDVQKAIRSGFGAIEAAGANAGPALGRYTRDEKAEDITGATVYAMTLTADWLVDLSA